MFDIRKLALASALTFAAGCSVATGETIGQTSEAVTGADLVYYGGPVVRSVKVFAVWWGPVANQSQLPAFYSALTNSAYMDWLSEYGTTGQPIGRGVYLGSVNAPPPSSSTIDDVTIRATLQAMVTSGALPAPDSNTVYANHFAPGITVTFQGNVSCEQFCGYHGTIMRSAGPDVFYTVIPDTGSGGCVGGCGSGTALQVQTTVASHQLIDAITDPAVGLAISNGPPLAWYDSRLGEVGDICNGQQASLASGWTVARGWSDYSSACVAQPSAKAPPPPPPPSCKTTTSCGSVVDVTCSAYTEPLVIVRTGSTGQPQQIGSLGQAGGTFVDIAPAATEDYEVCGVNTGTCSPYMLVNVDTAACFVWHPPVPIQCGRPYCI